MEGAAADSCATNLAFGKRPVVEAHFVDDTLEVPRGPPADESASSVGACDRQRESSRFAEDAVDVEIVAGLLEDDRQVSPAAVEGEAGAKALVVRVVAVTDVQGPSIQFHGDVAVDSQAGDIAKDEPVAALVGRGPNPGHERGIALKVQPLRLGDLHQRIDPVELQRGALASCHPPRPAQHAARVPAGGCVANLAALSFVEAPGPHQSPLGLRPDRCW